jgi:hypothetical protein
MEMNSPENCFSLKQAASLLGPLWLSGLADCIQWYRLGELVRYSGLRLS